MKMTRLTAAWLTAILLGACATAKPPVIDTGPDSEQTFDGLFRVKHARVDRAWARPGMDFTRFNKLLLQTAGVQYRPVDPRAGNRSAAASGRYSEFPMTDAQKEQLQKIVREAFVKEIRKLDEFTITTEPGPEVLTLRAGLLDVVSKVPPERIGRTDVYLESVGSATLVVELIDSQSDTVLVRAADARAAQQAGGYLQESNPVTNWAEVRRLAGYWAKLVRTRLDDLAAGLQIGVTE